LEVVNVLDLFSGIGGFSLGLERAGMKTVAFCEIDKKAQLVLRKHWLDVPIFEDVKTLTKGLLDERGISVDVICGGFPCQDISYAGRGAGLAGERSGLWVEFARLIGELRPQYAIVENVSALLSRGLDRVLGDLAQIGYDAEWHCIPASAVGAPHRRDRIWIMAYPQFQREWGRGIQRPDENCETVGKRQTEEFVGSSKIVAHASISGLQGDEWIGTTRTQRISARHITERRGWEPEPDVGRVANGVPGRMDRLKQLGNAVVPQIPEIIGRAIMEGLNNEQVGRILQQSKKIHREPAIELGD
jgi:DNA (cytosine-5)-methyltransferase 1